MDPNTPLSEIMTRTVKSVSPDEVFSELVHLFEDQLFHHIPVVDANSVPIGIISTHDYNTLKYHFSNMSWAKDQSKWENERLFKSLIAKDVMIKDPVCLKENDVLKDSLKVFLENKIHSILICNEAGQCTGIITPYDLLKQI